MSRLKKVANLIGHEHPIYALAISQKSHILFSGGGEGAVVEWSLKNMSHIKVMYKTNASIYCIDCPKALPLLISGDRAGQISIFNFEEQKLVFQKQLTTKPIFGLCTVDNLLYFISEDGIIRIFDLKQLTLLNEIEVCNSALRSIAYNLKENEICIGAKDNRIYYYSISEKRIVGSDEEHSLPVFSLSYDAQRNHIISGSRDAQIKVWTDKVSRNIPAHMFAVNNLISITEKPIFVSASMDKSIKVWDANTLDLLAIGDLQRNEGHSKSVNALAYTSYENYIISAGDDRMIMVWQFE